MAWLGDDAFDEIEPCRLCGRSGWKGLMVRCIDRGDTIGFECVEQGVGSQCRETARVLAARRGSRMWKADVLRVASSDPPPKKPPPPASTNGRAWHRVCAWLCGTRSVKNWSARCPLLCDIEMVSWTASS
jgi:hypothetical protein